ncbi:MAG: serine/threonine-protein kinase [Gemmatimonadaceae bacterium]
MTVKQDDPLAGRVFADRYTIDAQVGRGAMGVVYRAHDARHDRTVALKVLDPEIAQGIGTDRFLREIGTAARLSHPHIVPLHDSGESEGLLYYVMPFIDGATLRQRLERDGTIPTAEAVRITQQIANALDYAHKLGVVHRDIKPDNVMFHQGEAVVTDFGIAKAITAAGAEVLTATGTSIGTPAYMSPEQAAGSDDVDARSDQYSLACVLYEMLGGRPPFTGPSVQAIISKRFIEMPQPIGTLVPGVPEAVSRAVSRGLAMETGDRLPRLPNLPRLLEKSAVSNLTSRTRQADARSPCFRSPI